MARSSASGRIGSRPELTEKDSETAISTVRTTHDVPSRRRPHRQIGSDRDDNKTSYNALSTLETPNVLLSGFPALRPYSRRKASIGSIQAARRAG